MRGALIEIDQEQAAVAFATGAPSYNVTGNEPVQNRLVMLKLMVLGFWSVRTQEAPACP